MLQHVGCRLAGSVSSVFRRSLGMFSGKVNPVTGKMEWVLQDRDVTSEDSDLSPELARCMCCCGVEGVTLELCVTSFTNALQVTVWGHAP